MRSQIKSWGAKLSPARLAFRSARVGIGRMQTAASYLHLGGSGDDSSGDDTDGGGTVVEPPEKGKKRKKKREENSFWVSNSPQLVRALMLSVVSQS